MHTHTGTMYGVCFACVCEGPKRLCWVRVRGPGLGLLGIRRFPLYCKEVFGARGANGASGRLGFS